MEITMEFVRQFFNEKKQWAIPVALILFILLALIFVDGGAAAMAPVAFRVH